MRNLLRDRQCDQTIVHELERARIAIIRVDTPSGEVPSRLRGKLGPIVFVRRSTYWVADGPIPIAVALELYEHPIGRRFVHVGAVGTGPVPQGAHVTWHTSDGARVYPVAQGALDRSAHHPHAQAWMTSGPVVLHDRATAIGASGYIDRYSIDSEGGLQLFANTLRSHGIDQSARPSWWGQHHPGAGRTGYTQLLTIPPSCDDTEQATLWDEDTLDMPPDD
jgi:hypothetical protein